MFDDKFLQNLPEDPYEAAHAICKQFLEWHDEFQARDLSYPHYYDDFIDAYAAMEVFINATGLPFDTLTFEEDHSQNLKLIIHFFSRMGDELEKKVDSLKFAKAREKYAKYLGGVFLYEFSDGDLVTIQRLLDELRVTITESELFDAKHKQRILNKLESLQSELHKKMTSLAKFWDLIGDAGVVLGKFGKDAKPLVDRIREIAQIIWRTQARAEELPSGTPLPLLSNGKQEDD